MLAIGATYVAWRARAWKLLIALGLFWLVMYFVKKGVEVM